MRGDDLSETEEESDDEDFLSFETEDDTSGLDYDIYDFTSLYDTNSDDNDKTIILSSENVIWHPSYGDLKTSH